MLLVVVAAAAAAAAVQVRRVAHLSQNFCLK